MSVTSKMPNLWGSAFNWKYLKFNIDFRNGTEILENGFCFWDNCISVGIVNFSLLTTGYFSSAANVLTSRPKIWHVNTRGFFEHNILTSDKSLWSRCCNPDFNSALANLPYCLWKHPLKQHFLDIYLTTFSESVTSKIKICEGSLFFSKCVEFNLDFKNAAKNSEKLFCF